MIQLSTLSFIFGIVNNFFLEFHPETEKSSVKDIGTTSDHVRDQPQSVPYEAFNQPSFSSSIITQFSKPEISRTHQLLNCLPDLILEILMVLGNNLCLFRLNALRDCIPNSLACISDDNSEFLYQCKCSLADQANERACETMRGPNYQSEYSHGSTILAYSRRLPPPQIPIIHNIPYLWIP